MKNKIDNFLIENQGFIVHSLHKSGTMFLHKFFKDLSIEKRIKYFSRNNNPPDYQHLKQDTNIDFCLCPERNFNLEEYIFKNVKNITHIIQIRDPRDILVSEYFSLGWTHPDSQWSQERKKLRKWVQENSIDTYVVEASEKLFTFGDQPLKTRYQPLLNLSTLENRKIIIVKYEEMVTNYSSWLSKIIKSFQFNQLVASFLIQKYYMKYHREFKPRAENLVHKRKIIPGDHSNKLRPETIEQLNSIFQEILSKFNYF
ncbi:MAG: sulfotransferase domain-containing protein [cyanobacterium endosymbiont of Rhopalodia musculus]|uniref:sulfotransferase domain-containing protein n=1 Tax=cyanobacterium endosymbiont of Epithemia clementina EcSB TaxID=3034674 RepID=UPI002480B2C6|nr:sulfotransferase domain-containing protein [cyanobacterium endosymbiont of Epithemia clementina EcSB]WGT68302.1 sulfotransferase domain-containing protein [cyanobacterium endosymbiont of Epithemia clementina EcSB]